MESRTAQKTTQNKRTQTKTKTNKKHNNKTKHKKNKKQKQKQTNNTNTSKSKQTTQAQAQAQQNKPCAVTAHTSRRLSNAAQAVWFDTAHGHVDTASVVGCRTGSVGGQKTLFASKKTARTLFFEQRNVFFLKKKRFFCFFLQKMQPPKTVQFKTKSSHIVVDRQLATK